MIHNELFLLILMQIRAQASRAKMEEHVKVKSMVASVVTAPTNTMVQHVKKVTVYVKTMRKKYQLSETRVHVPF